MSSATTSTTFSGDTDMTTNTENMTTTTMASTSSKQPSPRLDSTSSSSLPPLNATITTTTTLLDISDSSNEYTSTDFDSDEIEDEGAEENENENEENDDDEDDDDDDNDDDLLSEEGFVDRLVALKDIVPPETRYNLTKVCSNCLQMTQSVAQFLGKFAWVVSTTSLIMVVPLLFELDKETQLVLFEKEQKLREQTAQQMLYPGTGPNNTLPKAQPR